MVRLKDINLYHKFTKWREPTGIFRCFFKATNFVTLKHYPDFDLIENKGNFFEKELLSIIQEYSRSSVFYIIELPGKKAVYSAYLINELLNLNPILTFNCILHPNGIIGNKEYISTLLIYADDIKRHESSNYAFIIDAERYDEAREYDSKLYFNNEYELYDTDLPSYEMLKEAELSELIYLHSGDIKEDIQGFLDYYSENGLKIVEKVINI